MSRPTFITFAGGWESGPMGRLMSEAQTALTLDLLEAALRSEAFDRHFLVTDIPDLAANVPSGVTVEEDSGDFHFGERFRDLILRHEIERPFYLGGGSGPLLSSEGLTELARRLEASESAVLTNNRFSADLVAFTPGEAIARVELPATDNPLPRLLRSQAGLEVVELQRTTALTFDIDTPTDFLVLRLHPNAGGRARAFLDGLDFNDARLREAMMLFTDPDAEVTIAGRAPSQMVMYMQTETACRERFIIEERGMQSVGRDRPGGVKSVLGYHYEAVGAQRFFDMLATLGQAVFLDTRVLFFHLGLDPSAEDRFASDLGLWEQIQEPTVRSFTKAALDSPVPVILGGHSLVAGGLMALVDAGWLEHDRLTGKTPPVRLDVL